MAYGNVNVASYTSKFFQIHGEESLQSAKQVIPQLLALFTVSSVVEIGCGAGAWISTFTTNEVTDVAGVDGDYVDRDSLLFDVAAFHSHDLTEPLDLGRRYDLAVCIEVAEHLPAGKARVLVETLTRHSDLVLFSAAIPGQGGTNHINEQWPSYWVAEFRALGFHAFDVMRPRLWHDRTIGFWLRQNLLIFASERAADLVRSLPSVEPPVDIVHPEQFQHKLASADATPSIRTSLRHLTRGVVNRLSRSIQRH